ncbi:MAG: hypothetical protein ACI4VQ_03280 [Clostridia bacterium]
MALERQITFQTNVINTIDGEINSFLKANAIDPAGVQIVISDALGLKTATLSYGDREEIKAAYEAQGRVYSEADEVTYCYVKDIVVPLNGLLDAEVNEFLSNGNISVISVARYFTAVNKGALIFFIDIEEQKEKAEKKKAEIEKAREELAQKLASQAVKDVSLDTNDAIEKYAGMSEQEPTHTEETSEEIKTTAGLSQVQGEVENPEYTITTANTQTLAYRDIKNEEIINTTKKKKLFGKNK